MPAGQVTLFDLAWGMALRAASDTGKTHWESASKRQLVGLRCPTQLGDSTPGGKRHPAARTGGQRASDSWSSYAVQPGWGMAPRQQSTPATRTRGQRVGANWSGYVIRSGWGLCANNTGTIAAFGEQQAHFLAKTPQRRRRQPRCRSSSSQKAAGQLAAIAEKDLSPATNGGKGAGFDQFRRRIAAGTQAFPQNIRRRKMEIPPKNNISACF